MVDQERLNERANQIHILMDAIPYWVKRYSVIKDRNLHQQFPFLWDGNN